MTGTDLTAIPEHHRRAIAAWLVERAGQFEPSFLLTPETAGMIQDALTGAAVDLCTPDAEDTTVGHAAAVLSSLRPDTDRDPDGPVAALADALLASYDRAPQPLRDAAYRCQEADQSTCPMLGVAPLACCYNSPGAINYARSVMSGDTTATETYAAVQSAGIQRAAARPPDERDTCDGHAS